MIVVRQNSDFVASEIKFKTNQKEETEKAIYVEGVICGKGLSLQKFGDRS